MRVVLSPYESRATSNRWSGVAVEWPTFSAEVPVCASPDCAELLGNFGVPLVPIGEWR